MAQQLESEMSSAYLESVRLQRVKETKEMIRQNQAQREVDILPADEEVIPLPQDIEKPVGPADARMTLTLGADVALGLLETPVQVTGGLLDVPNQAIENIEELANIVSEIAQPEIDEELDRLAAEAIPTIDAAREFFPSIDLLIGAGIGDFTGEVDPKIEFPRIPTPPGARTVTGNFIRNMTKAIAAVVVGGKALQLGTKAVGKGLQKVTKGKVGKRLAEKKLSLTEKAVGGSAVAAGALQDIEKGSEGVALLLTENTELQSSLLQWLAEPDPKRSKILETATKRMIGDLLDTATAAGVFKGFKEAKNAIVKVKGAFEKSALGKARKAKKEERLAAEAVAGKLRNKVAKESVDSLGDPNSEKFFFTSRDAEKEFNAFFRVKEGLKEFAAVSDVVLKDGKYVINYSKLNTVDDLQALFDKVTQLEARAIGKDPTLITKPAGQAKFEAVDEFPTFKDFLGIEGKGPFSDAQVRAAKALIVSSSRQTRVYAGRALTSGAESDKIVARRAIGIHGAMVKLFKEKRTEAGRTLQAYAGIKGDDLDLALKMDAFVDEAGGAKTLDEMNSLIFHSANARALTKSADDMVASTWGRAIETYVLVNWLSGVGTAVKNVTGNSSAAVWFPVEKMAAAVHSQIFGDRSIGYGESVATAFGMVKGMKDGLALAFRAEKAQNVGHRAEKFTRTQKVEGITGNAINSTLLRDNVFSEDSFLGHGLNFIGHIYAQPTKILLERPDMFFKNTIYTGELHGLAYNQVRAEGLSGPAAVTRMKELVSNPPKEMDYGSFDMAEQLTFVKKVDGLPRDLKRAIRNTKYIGWAINPFFNTRFNLWNYKFERTPLARLSQKVREDLDAGGRRRSLALGKIGATNALLMTCVDFAMDGLITGDGPKDPGLNRNWKDTGKKPSSFKYGDNYIQVDKLDPIGGFVAQCGKIGEIINNVDEKTAAELVTSTILTYYDLLNPEQFIGGVGSFLGFMSDANFDSSVEDFLVNFTTGATFPMSSFFRGITKAEDPFVKIKKRKLTREERAIPGIDLELQTFLDNLTAQAQSQYWFTAEDVPPFHNRYGEPISTASGFGYAYDMAGPASIGKVTGDPVKEFMEKHEVAFDNVALNFERVSLTNAEASWYQKLAGESLKKDLVQLIKNPGFQAATDGANGRKTVIVKALAARHRAIAQEKLKKMFPDLQRRIWDAQEKDIKDKSGVDVNIGARIPPPVTPVTDSKKKESSVVDKLGGK